MLTCIACSKQLHGGNNGSMEQRRETDDNDFDDEYATETPRTKQAIRNLTAQIKDMAIKASGAYKNCKPCSGSSSNKQDGNHAESDAASDSARFQCSYRRTGNLDSTPKILGKEMDSRVKGMMSSGEGTPASGSGRTESVGFTEDDEPKEWVAQVEPGVLITFVSLPEGGNDLKRIRFSREMFNKLQAQRWWAENYDKVMELYNVQQFNQQAVPFPTPSRSEDEIPKHKSGKDSPTTPPLDKERPCKSRSSQQPMQSRQYYDSPGGVGSTAKLSDTSGAKTETSSMDVSARTSLASSREVDHSGEMSPSNASETEAEWVEQDEPGVYITVRALPGGARELRRIRFSREMFGEMQARVWWEENKSRIQQLYL
ncbi:Protein Brevis radix-like 2 [Linum grandiflorum]